ncbi:MAG: hypothetical protein ACF8XB_15260, partial [Planctomycetota bacterium JB042]
PRPHRVPLFSALHELARTHVERGRPGEAEELFLLLLDRLGRGPAMRRHEGLARRSYGLALAKWGRIDEAERELREAHRQLSEALRPHHRLSRAAAATLADFLRDRPQDASD